MTPYYQDDSVTIYHGDCRDILQTLDNSVAAVVTSPPYAEQRKHQYGGISENQYPVWTVGWLTQVARVLEQRGSVVINIRPHLRNGALSDYVLRTRLAVREAGWVECEELIWLKPWGTGPFGSINRPRRAWEHLLWFGRTGDVWSDPKANGTLTTRAAKDASFYKGAGDYIARAPQQQERGVPTLCLDVVSVPVRGVYEGVEEHPAPYPIGVPKWVIQLIARPDSVVLDPFMGSGTTLRAAKDLGRKAIGIEIEERYCEIAARRMAQEVLSL